MVFLINIPHAAPDMVIIKAIVFVTIEVGNGCASLIYLCVVAHACK